MKSKYVKLNGFKFYTDLSRYFGWTIEQIDELSFVEIKYLWIILGINPLDRYLETIK